MTTNNKTFRIGNFYVKQFQYEGQMINYFNKLRQNKSLKMITCGTNLKYGYVCKWAY